MLETWENSSWQFICSSAIFDFTATCWSRLGPSTGNEDKNYTRVLLHTHMQCIDTTQLHMKVYIAASLGSCLGSVWYVHRDLSV